MSSRPRALIAGAAERNKQPILDILKKFLSPSDKLFALEISSGTGQHVTYFGKHFSNINWLPSDVDKASLASIEEHIKMNELTNVRKPEYIDVTEPPEKWANGSLEKESVDAMLNINLIHISPFKCTTGLFQGANYLLKPNGLLITYGPYAVDGVITPQSNVDFDKHLRAMNPEYGVRDIRDLTKLAIENGLKLENTIEMPANNKTLIFRKLLKNSS